MNLEEMISKIVRQYVGELLQNQLPLPEQPQKKVLILMMDDRYETEITEVTQSISNQYNLVFANCKDLSNHQKNEWDQLICQMDLIVVPVLTIGALVKISNLIDDEPASAIVTGALLKGKRVVVSNKYVVPSGFERAMIPPGILDTISGHFQNIRRYGIHITSLNNLAQTVHDLFSSKPDGRRPLIHAKHVRDWINEGENRITIPNNAMITSLAKEEAKALGLTFNSRIEESR